MYAKAVFAMVVVGTVWWWIGRLLRQRSYAFRLGRLGLWIDGEFYFWRQLYAITHYADLQTLLVKVKRDDDLPLALQVKLTTTRFRGATSEQLREQFERHAANLEWKSV